MTASYNISFLGSPEQAEGSASKKNYRSCKYNNYMVEVVDFDKVCINRLARHQHRRTPLHGNESVEYATDFIQHPCKISDRLSFFTFQA